MSALNKPVLVLNKMWIPIRVISVIRALKTIIAGKASAVNPDDYYIYGWEEWIKQPLKDGDSIIKSVRYDVKVPEVIVLSRYDKVFRKDSKIPTKRSIYMRDGYICQYTGEKIKPSKANIDHIIHKNKGGKNTWKNMIQ